MALNQLLKSKMTKMATISHQQQRIVHKTTAQNVIKRLLIPVATNTISIHFTKRSKNTSATYVVIIFHASASSQTICVAFTWKSVYSNAISVRRSSQPIQHCICIKRFTRMFLNAFVRCATVDFDRCQSSKSTWQCIQKRKTTFVKFANEDSLCEITSPNIC